jgi:hypothetical protein
VREDVHTGFWWGILRARGHFGDPGIDGRIILRLIVRKWDVEYGLDRAGSGLVQVVGTCESGKEPLGSIQCGEFLDWLKTG